MSVWQGTPATALSVRRLYLRLCRAGLQSRLLVYKTWYWHGAVRDNNDRQRLAGGSETRDAWPECSCAVHRGVCIYCTHILYTAVATLGGRQLPVLVVQPAGMTEHQYVASLVEHSVSAVQATYYSILSLFTYGWVFWNHGFIIWAVKQRVN